MSKEITDKDFDKEVLKSDLPVLVDFYAVWCGPCQMMAPVIEEIGKKYDGKLKVYKLNTDESTQTAMNFQIMSIPTLIIFKAGKEAKRLVGFQPKERLAAELDRFLK
jgi:thioredoxin 1